jgi:hypothetical protein
MQKILYDVRTGKITDRQEYGSCGFISFNRLLGVLSDSGEFKPGERISQIRITELGLTFVFEGVE